MDGRIRANAACGFFFIGPALFYWTLMARMPALKARAALSESEIGRLLLAPGISAVLMIAASSRLVARFGSRRILAAGVLSAAAGLVTAAGAVMSVTPHVGIRYTNIDVDSYRGLDTGAMDVVEMPVGVKVAGNFETAGWKVTPAVDFTVVPQVGDKQVDTVVGAVDVIDNLYNTTLGVSAEYGNFTFGLNYRYGFGNNDRKNNSVNANVRYMF